MLFSGSDAKASSCTRKAGSAFMRAIKVLKPALASAGTSGTPTAKEIENVSGAVVGVVAGAGVSTAALGSAGFGSSALISGLASTGGGRTATLVSGGVSKERGALGDVAGAGAEGAAAGGGATATAFGGAGGAVAAGGGVTAAGGGATTGGATAFAAAGA